MIKLAPISKDNVILMDTINDYHKNPLFFDTLRDMFKYIEKEFGYSATMITISWSGGIDDRFKCEKDPEGFLTWRTLSVYDPKIVNNKVFAYCDLGERTIDDI